MEGKSQQERKKVRNKLGSLKGLTVQPGTRQRYTECLNRFFDWMTGDGLVLPKQQARLDGLVSDYLEHLWASGEGRSIANNTLAALQDRDPSLKKKLPGSWRLLKAWTTVEIPNRAPPMTLQILDALCGWSIFKGCPEFGLSLRIAFYGLLRTGGLLSLRAKDVFIPGPKGPAVLSLGLTKGGARQGAAESVTLHERSILPDLWKWKQVNAPSKFLAPKPHAWRALFTKAIEALKLNDLRFRPYSLRRGGATFWFNQHGSFDKLLVQGRWAAARTARVYLNDGLAQLADMSLSNSVLIPYVNLYRKSPNLEPGPPQGGSRSGGRGAKARKGRKVKFLAFSVMRASISRSGEVGETSHQGWSESGKGFPLFRRLSLGSIGFGGCGPRRH